MKPERSYRIICAISGERNGNPLQYACWRIPWIEEPGRLWSMGSHRVGHDWVTNIHTCTSYTIYWVLIFWKQNYMTVNEIQKWNDSTKVYMGMITTKLLMAESEELKSLLKVKEESEKDGSWGAVSAREPGSLSQLPTCPECCVGWNPKARAEWTGPRLEFGRFTGFNSTEIFWLSAVSSPVRQAGDTQGGAWGGAQTWIEHSGMRARWGCTKDRTNSASL